MKNVRARWPNSNEDWRVALAVHADLQQMGMPRANLLLVGVDDRLQRILELSAATTGNRSRSGLRPAARAAWRPIR